MEKRREQATGAVVPSTSADIGIDLSRATPAEASLHRNLVESFRVTRQAMIRVFYYLGVIEETRTYRSFGCRSMAAYARRATGLPEHTVTEMLTLSRRMRMSPALAEAVESGELSWRKALLISRQAAAPDGPLFIDLARRLTTKELRAALRRALDAVPGEVPGPVLADRAPVEPGLAPAPSAIAGEGQGEPVVPEARQPASPPSRESPRTISGEPQQPAAPRRHRVDGCRPGEPAEYVLLRLSAEQFARWQAVVHERGEALVERILQALAGKSNDRPHSQLIMLHCPTCAATTLNTSRGELPADRALIEAAACDSVVEDLDARQRHSIAPRLRRLVLRRSRLKCEAERCNNTRWLDVHHRVLVSEGGTNDPENLIVLCRRCHLKLHDRELALRNANQGRPDVGPSGHGST